jgi:hypothetical protein
VPGVSRGGTSEDAGGVDRLKQAKSLFSKRRQIILPPFSFFAGIWV